MAGNGLVLAGVAALLDGQADRADAVLAHAVEVGMDGGAMPATATALAERCLLAMRRNDWTAAQALAEQAVGIVAAGHLEDYIMSALAHAVAARTALHRGAPWWPESIWSAARLRPLLTYAIPVLAVQTLLELGRAYRLLDDPAGAGVVLRQAREVLRLRPDLGGLPAEAEELRAGLDLARQVSPGASSLTTAELRLLPLLATHLTLAEIGQRLYVQAHGQDPGDLDLPQARRLLPQPGGPAAAGDRPARRVARRRGAEPDAGADLARNRALWTAVNAEFTDRTPPPGAATELTWGLFSIPERDLGVLGDVTGLDVVELGCGTAYLSAQLARQGARPVGVDLNAAQLAIAARCQERFGLAFPWSRRTPSTCHLPTGTSTWWSASTGPASGAILTAGSPRRLGCYAPGAAGVPDQQRPGHPVRTRGGGLRPGAARAAAAQAAPAGVATALVRASPPTPP